MAGIDELHAASSQPFPLAVRALRPAGETDQGIPALDERPGNVNEAGRQRGDDPHAILQVPETIPCPGILTGWGTRRRSPEATHNPCSRPWTRDRGVQRKTTGPWLSLTKSHAAPDGLPASAVAFQLLPNESAVRPGLERPIAEQAIEFSLRILSSNSHGKTPCRGAIAFGLGGRRVG